MFRLFNLILGIGFFWAGWTLNTAYPNTALIFLLYICSGACLGHALMPRGC